MAALSLFACASSADHCLHVSSAHLLTHTLQHQLTLAPFSPPCTCLHTGDGAGMLCAMPDSFLSSVLMDEQSFKLPPLGDYAVGMVSQQPLSRHTQQYTSQQQMPHSYAAGNAWHTVRVGSSWAASQQTNSLNPSAHALAVALPHIFAYASSFLIITMKHTPTNHTHTHCWIPTQHSTLPPSLCLCVFPSGVSVGNRSKYRLLCVLANMYSVCVCVCPQVFMPREESERNKAKCIMERVAAKLGHDSLTWRVVPTSNKTLGKSAVDVEPHIEQWFLSAHGNKDHLDTEQQVGG